MWGGFRGRDSRESPSPLASPPSPRFHRSSQLKDLRPGLLQVLLDLFQPFQGLLQALLCRECTCFSRSESLAKSLFSPVPHGFGMSASRFRGLQREPYRLTSNGGSNLGRHSEDLRRVQSRCRRRWTRPGRRLLPPLPLLDHRLRFQHERGRAFHRREPSFFHELPNTLR